MHCSILEVYKMLEMFYNSPNFMMLNIFLSWNNLLVVAKIIKLRLWYGPNKCLSIFAAPEILPKSEKTVIFQEPESIQEKNGLEDSDSPGKKWHLDLNHHHSSMLVKYNRLIPF